MMAGLLYIMQDVYSSPAKYIGPKVPQNRDPALDNILKVPSKPNQ